MVILICYGTGISLSITSNIADYCLDEYEAVLRELYPNQEEEFYEYGKWGALTTTNAFRKVPIEEQWKIKLYIYQNNLPK